MLTWPLLIALLIAISTVVPWFFWWLSQRSGLRDFFQSLHGVQAAFIGVTSMLFSLNLVFVCNEIWQAREMAKSAMAKEADGLRNIGRIASNIPKQGGLIVLQRAREYLSAAHEFDFADSEGQVPQQSNGTSLKGIIALSDSILSNDTLEKMNPVVQQLLVSQLTMVREKRLERIALLRFKPNWVKWVSLFFLELMTLLSIAVVHVANGRALVAACFIFLSCANPFLTILYCSQSPFLGLNPLKDAPLLEALSRLDSMTSEYKLRSKDAS